MRFSLPIFALTAATSAAVITNRCAICRDTIPPGPPEVSWALVWKDEIAEDVTLCGYHGKSHRNPNNTATTFCEYATNTGTRIENDLAWDFCPKMVKLGPCN